MWSNQCQPCAICPNHLSLNQFSLSQTNHQTDWIRQFSELFSVFLLKVNLIIPLSLSHCLTACSAFYGWMHLMLSVFSVVKYKLIIDVLEMILSLVLFCIQPRVLGRWCSGMVVGLAIKTSQVWLPVGAWLRNGYGQVVYTLVPCHQAVWYDTDQWAMMLCSWERNCRSGIALAMNCWLKWFISVWLSA